MNINIILLSILGVALPVNGLAADPPARRSENFAARSLKVQPMPGNLRVNIGAGPHITLTLIGPARIVAAVRVNMDQGALVVEPPAEAAGSTVYIEEGITVIARDGGTASVVIGGQDRQSGQREPPLEVLVTVPTGTPVEVKDLLGSAEIGDTHGPLALAVASGTATVGQVRDAAIDIAGSGDISITRVAGSLVVDLTGSGSVTVGQAELDRLRVDLSGSGNVQVGGRTRQAELNLTGAGVIEVSEVVSQPAIRITGAGEVRVGNW